MNVQRLPNPNPAPTFICKQALAIRASQKLSHWILDRIRLRQVVCRVTYFPVYAMLVSNVGVLNLNIVDPTALLGTRLVQCFCPWVLGFSAKPALSLLYTKDKTHHSIGLLAAVPPLVLITKFFKSAI